MTRILSLGLAGFCISTGLVVNMQISLAQHSPRGVRWVQEPGTRAIPPAIAAPGTPPAILSSYKFTIFDFPGSLTTVGFGINSGASSSKIEIVGAIGNNPTGPIAYTGGYLLHYSKSKGTTTEAYRAENIAGATLQAASGVNDSGEIVGFYADSLAVVHGYLENGGTFTTIDVPFPGATATGAFSINNSGQIVGAWNDATTSHGFMLSGGTYTSIDYPGSFCTLLDGINKNGQIVGTYCDASGVEHGFSLIGGTYTSFDVPGSTLTAAIGINDSGDIVGQYCLTTECASVGDTLQGFLLSGGTYTTITIPGAISTIAVAINNKGFIVGAYYDSVGNHGYLASP